MDKSSHRVAIIGCGRTTYSDTEIVAIAERNPERFSVSALCTDVHALLLRGVVTDIAAIMTPSNHCKDAVIACRPRNL